MNTNLTMLAINVQLLKSAQIQQELSLKLIEASMDSLEEPVAVEVKSTKVQPVEGSSASEQDGSIDIRV